jgi:hypothetical protein
MISNIISNINDWLGMTAEELIILFFLITLLLSIITNVAIIVVKLLKE